MIVVSLSKTAKSLMLNLIMEFLQVYTTALVSAYGLHSRTLLLMSFYVYSVDNNNTGL